MHTCVQSDARMLKWIKRSWFAMFPHLFFMTEWAPINFIYPSSLFTPSHHTCKTRTAHMCAHSLAHCCWCGIIIIRKLVSPVVFKHRCDGFSLPAGVARFCNDHHGHWLSWYLLSPWFMPLLGQAGAGSITWYLFQASQDPVPQSVYHCQDMGTLPRNTAKYLFKKRQQIQLLKKQNKQNQKKHEVRNCAAEFILQAKAKQT